MKSVIFKSVLLTGLTTLSGTWAIAQKKPLDHSVYDGWKSIRGTQLSRDGKWVAYTIAPQEGDAVGYVRNIVTEKEFKLDRGTTLQFTYDSKFVVATIAPKLEDTKKARRDKVAPDAMPKSSVAILNLDSGERSDLPKAVSFELAEQDRGTLLYTVEPPRPAPPARGGSAIAPTAPVTPPPGEAAPDGVTSDEEITDQGSDLQRRTRPAGAVAPAAGQRPGVAAGGPTRPTYVTVVLRSLATGKEETIPQVDSRILAKDGSLLLYSHAATNAKERNIIAYDLINRTKTIVSAGLSKYSRLTWNDKAKSLAFISDKAPGATPRVPAIHLWKQGDAQSRVVLADGDKAFPKNWVLTDTSSLSFSDRGSRLTFSVMPKPPTEKKDETPDDEKVSVDVWHYQDPTIQAQQLVQAGTDRSQSYAMLLEIGSGRVLQLGNEMYPNVAISNKGEGRYGLATSDIPYRIRSTWDPGYHDTYLVDVTSGKALKVRENETGSLSFSPTGRYLVGYDSDSRQYYSVDTNTLKRKVLTAGIKFPLYDELHDTPDAPAAYGIAGWTKNDDRFMVYDSYDIWLVDPTGTSAPECVTARYGRTNDLRLRYQESDPNAEFIDTTKPMLLSILNLETKAGGFATVDPTTKRFTKLVYGDKSYAVSSRAKDADVMIYTQQDFVEYPDLWVSSKDFKNGRKITDANPQQRSYYWGKAELISWTSNDGIPLKGILVKPENFDYSKKYPMITYYYERSSDTLHRYTPPAPSASTVNIPFFASNGYVMFIPDIPYKEGYPGESAASAILPGVQAVLARGYVDPKRLGIQGQSWGGYQTAWLITETKMFAAACSGAAVSDMFSAYGGIRYGTGLLRQMQYEHGQSRIGGTPWEKPLRYLENSPLFFLDKVTTPLLMMHNDKDGSVPWTQGVELYSGMRRLQKPCWMITYNGEDHNLVERKNRKDWTIRLSQFFDYYLKGEPMPVWMSKGIPATMKGKTMGLELEKK